MLVETFPKLKEVDANGVVCPKTGALLNGEEICADFCGSGTGLPFNKLLIVGGVD